MGWTHWVPVTVSHRQSQSSGRSEVCVVALYRPWAARYLPAGLLRAVPPLCRTWSLPFLDRGSHPNEQGEASLFHLLQAFPHIPCPSSISHPSRTIQGNPTCTLDRRAATTGHLTGQLSVVTTHLRSAAPLSFRPSSPPLRHVRPWNLLLRSPRNPLTGFSAPPHTAPTAPTTPTAAPFRLSIS